MTADERIIAMVPATWEVDIQPLATLNSKSRTSTFVKFGLPLHDQLP